MIKKTLFALFFMFLGLASFPLLNDLASYMTWNDDTKTPFWQEFRLKLVAPEYGVYHAFLGNCTKDVRKNGLGWVFVNREYFACNRLEILYSDYVYGEITSRHRPELVKKLKSNYRYQ